jgi:hypothetical protein
LILAAGAFVTATGVLAAKDVNAGKPAPGDESPATRPAGRKLAVFVLAGQSNMQGAGEAAKLPAALKGAQKDVLLFNGKPWQPLQPRKRFGPEVTFGKAMAAALGRPVGIVKFAVGGSHLVYDWNPKFKEKNNYYGKTLAMVKAAGKSRPIEIVGMLWMQGERDSLFAGAAAKYAANLEALVKSARADYGAPQMPFVLGRVNPPPGRYKSVAKVREAQQEISLPKTAWVNCDDLAKRPDNLHYDTKGQMELGRRFAGAMLKLMGGKPSASQPAE